MLATPLAIVPPGGFQWTPATPRVGRRAVSYYGRWPSPTQARSILLRAKELLPIVAFLEACAVLQLIQEYREQPGILTWLTGKKSTEYRPDFIFSRNGSCYLVFASARSISQVALLNANLIAYCGAEICHFRVCRFLPEKACIAALSVLSPAQLKRGLLGSSERRMVISLFDELMGTP